MWGFFFHGKTFEHGAHIIICVRSNFSQRQQQQQQQKNTTQVYNGRKYYIFGQQNIQTPIRMFAKCNMYNVVLVDNIHG